MDISQNEAKGNALNRNYYVFRIFTTLKHKNRSISNLTFQFCKDELLIKYAVILIRFTTLHIYFKKKLL